MAKLIFREKKALEEYLDMQGGFVLNFSDRTFANFFRDFDVDINHTIYIDGHSGSKANRLRSFWDKAPNHLVGRVIGELVEYSESYRPNYQGADICRAIAMRLQAEELTPANSQNTLLELKTVNINPVINTQPIEIFFSYAHEDEGLMDIVRQQLIVHERIGTIVKWHDRKIPAGDEWRTQIDDKINQANVILLFMSPDFIASRYCYENEGAIALRRHREGTARVIPVVLRPCDWAVSPFGKLQALPKDAVPLTQWPDRDQASLDIARGIMDSIR